MENFRQLIRTLLLLALVAAATIGTRVEAQSEATGSLTGFVHDASDGEAPIAATVLLQGTLIGGLSNTSGYYVIPQIPVGDYTLVRSYIGYQTFRRNVRVAADEKVDTTLAVEAVTAAEMVIRADSMRTSEMLSRSRSLGSVCPHGR